MLVHQALGGTETHWPQLSQAVHSKCSCSVVDGWSPVVQWPWLPNANPSLGPRVNRSTHFPLLRVHSTPKLTPSEDFWVSILPTVHTSVGLFAFFCPSQSQMISVSPWPTSSPNSAITPGSAATPPPAQTILPFETREIFLSVLSGPSSI